ncbi:B-cell linker protein-like isoform X4 [Argonauta hians]
MYDENYDSFDYPSEPKSGPAPPLPSKLKDPPLPPLRKMFKNIGKSVSPPTNNNVLPCDETYEEFDDNNALPCDETYEEFDDNETDGGLYEPMIENEAPPITPKKPELPNRTKPSLKPEVKPKGQHLIFACSPTEKQLKAARGFLKSTERQQSWTLPRLPAQIPSPVKRVVEKKDPIAPNNGFSMDRPPILPPQTQEEPEDEDPSELYGDALDFKSFLTNQPWYFGKIARKTEESLLNETKKNGSFLVRDSTQASTTHPFTLTVYCNQHLYRLKIRHLESEKYVVGEKKESELEFNTLEELVDYYRREPLILLASGDKNNSCTQLKYSPDKKGASI